jgi:hypothetical protein
VLGRDECCPLDSTITRPRSFSMTFSHLSSGRTISLCCQQIIAVYQLIKLLATALESPSAILSSHFQEDERGNDIDMNNLQNGEDLGQIEDTSHLLHHIRVELSLSWSTDTVLILCLTCSMVSTPQTLHILATNLEVTQDRMTSWRFKTSLACFVP